MERYELVDENGKGTGKIVTDVEVRDLNNVSDGYYVAIVGVVIINNKNEVLLQKRSRLKTINPGKWGICGGKIDFEETPIEAGVRETFEEIGVEIHKENLKFLHKEAVEEKFHCTIYYINQDVDINKCTLRKEEVEELKYFKLEELETLDNEGLEWLDNLKEIIK